LGKGLNKGIMGKGVIKKRGRNIREGLTGYYRSGGFINKRQVQVHHWALRWSKKGRGKKEKEGEGSGSTRGGDWEGGNLYNLPVMAWIEVKEGEGPKNSLAWKKLK